MKSEEIDRNLLEYDQWCEGKEEQSVKKFGLERGLSPEMVAELEEIVGAGRRLATQQLSGAQSVFQIPKTLGDRFQILHKLGDGGMGSVWLAEQRLPIQRRVAIKLIRPELLADSAKQRFAFEQQALAKLNHPNIAKVFEASDSECELPYFVMEFIEGEDLVSYARRNQLIIG